MMLLLLLLLLLLLQESLLLLQGVQVAKLQWSSSRVGRWRKEQIAANCAEALPIPCALPGAAEYNTP